MRRNASAFFISIAIISTLMLFQNCSSDAPLFASSTFDKLAASDDFPYRADFDQIAYMSCSEQENVSSDPQTFFTFRVGAYREGGLSLTEEFLEETVRMKDQSIIDVLGSHTKSRDSRLQFAVRSSNNFQLSFVNENSGATGREGIDFDNAFVPLGDESLSQQLLARPNNEPMNFFPLARFDGQARLEGTMVFNSSEKLARELRSFLNQEGLLALTFSSEGTINPRGPAYGLDDESDMRNNIYGTGVTVRFKQPTPADYPQAGNGLTNSNMPSRLLSVIEELPMIDSARSNPTRRWTCNRQMAFMIVMPDDALRLGNCNMVQDPANPSQVLQAVRQSLYGEDWYVDVANRCVVPKADRVVPGSCYGTRDNNEIYTVNYDFTTECGFQSPNGVCPHFVSICIRE